MLATVLNKKDNNITGTPTRTHVKLLQGHLRELKGQLTIIGMKLFLALYYLTEINHHLFIIVFAHEVLFQLHVEYRGHEMLLHINICNNDINTYIVL